MNNKITLVLRILVGVAMLVFGANKFYSFMPEPDLGSMGVQMQTLMGVLAASPFLKIIGLIEVLAGAALLFGKYVPLALVFLVAVMFNAVLFHVFFDKASNAAGGGVFLALCLVLVYTYKDRFKSILSA